MKRVGYEPELQKLADMVRDGDICADVGANFGIYSLAMASNCGSGTVFSFEPGAVALDQLRFNCNTLNASLPIQIVPTALSDQTGATALHHVGGAPTTFSLAPKNQIDLADAEEVDLVPFDLWARHAISRLDVMKIDVEGHEPKVLMGAAHSIATYKPIIMFEVSRDALARSGSAVDDSFAILKEHAYDFFIFEPNANSFLRLTVPREGNIYGVPECRKPRVPGLPS